MTHSESDEYFGKVYDFLRKNIESDVDERLELGQQHMMGKLEAMLDTSFKDLNEKFKAMLTQQFEKNKMDVSFSEDEV